jgi:hypothetical protein
MHGCEHVQVGTYAQAREQHAISVMRRLAGRQIRNAEGHALGGREAGTK